MSMSDCTQTGRLERIDKLLDGNGQPGVVKQVERNTTLITEMKGDIETAKSYSKWSMYLNMAVLTAILGMIFTIVRNGA